MKGFVYDINTNRLYNVNNFPTYGMSFDNIKSISDINNNGSFVGIASVNGIEHGFIATISVPEPSSLSLVATGFLMLMTKRRPKKSRK